MAAHAPSSFTLTAAPEDAGNPIHEGFRRLAECASGFAMFMLDPHGRVLIWSAGAERTNGYRAEEIVGRHVSCFYLPEDVARGVPEQQIQCAARNGYLASEGWRVRKNGSRFWASIVTTALRDTERSLHGFTQLVRDATAHGPAPERALATVLPGEALSWAALSAVPEQICVLDADGTIVLTNRSWDQSAAARGAELSRCGTGRNYLRICRAAMGKSAEGAARAADGIESVLRGALPRFTMEYQCPSPARSAWFQMTAVPLRRPHTGALISHADITDRAVLARKLHRSEAFYGALLENSADVSAILAPDGTIRYQHPSCEYMVGFRADELVGRQFFEFVHPDDLEAVRSVLQGCLRRPHLRRSATYRFREKHGSWLVVKSRVQNLVSNPAVAGIVVSARDVTGDTRERKGILENQSALEHDRDELRLLAARMFRDEEDGRRRLAADLHDNLGLRLAALVLEAGSLAARAASAPAVQAGLHELQASAASLGHDLRRVADGLRPSVLAHLGLGVALRDRCAEFTTKTGIAVRYSHRGLSSHIPQKIAACLYRTAESALAWVAAQGDAESVSVTVSWTAAGLRLVVRYSGAGCEPPVERPGRGLEIMSMGERLRAVNGSLNIRSRPRHGAEIAALVPFDLPSRIVGNSNTMSTGTRPPASKDM